MDLEVVVDPSIEPSIDFVFVHGLTEFRDEAEDDSKPILNDDSWILRRLPNDYPGCRVSIFNYAKRKRFETVFTPEGAKAETLRLLDNLLSFREDPKTRGMVLIGHDVGGILIKNALVYAYQRLGKYGSVFFSVSTIVYLGCPHEYTNLTKLREGLVKLLQNSHSTNSTEEYAWELAGFLPDLIAEAGSHFRDLSISMAATTINVCSIHENQSTCVFDEPGLMNLRPSEATYVIKPSTHSELLSRDDAFEHIVKLLKPDLLRDQDIRRHIWELTLQAPPPATPELMLCNSLWLEKILDDKAFLDWKTKQSPTYLLVQCQSRDTAASVGNTMFSHLGDKRIEGADVVWLYFAFSLLDRRYGTAEAVLYSFLGQLIAQLRYGDQETLFSNAFTSWHERYSVFGTFTLEDLFSLFHEILLLLDSHGHGITCVLSNFDENVASYERLVDMFNELANECEINFRILATHADEPTKQDCCLKWARISLPENFHGSGHIEIDLPIQTTKEITKDFEQELALIRLIKERPNTYGIAARIDDLLQKFSKDKKLCKVVLGWLRTSDLTLLTNSILVPEREIARILRLVLHAVRPLTITEFQDIWIVSGIGQAKEGSITTNCRPPEGITLLSCGLLEPQGNEVGFAHPFIPSILSKSLRRTGHEETREHDHQEIMNLCLKYITSSRGRDLSTAELQTEENGLILRHHFLAYAVQYWPRHAVLSGIEWCSTNPQIQEFLKDQELQATWAKLYWALANPLSHIHQPSVRPEYIFAIHGLSALLNFSSTGVLATLKDHELVKLLEYASKAGQREVVQHLLNLPFQKIEILDSTILAAFHSGDEQIISGLIDFALTTPKMINDPYKLLCRAASLNHIITVEKLIPLAKQKGVPDTISHCISVLQHACARNKYEVIEIIIKNDLVVSHADIWTSLQLACKYSSPHAVTLLLNAAVERSQPDMKQDYKNLLDITIKFGKFSNFNVILKRPELAGLKSELVIAMLDEVITTRHIKCGQILMSCIKGSINPEEEDYRSKVSRTIERELDPLFEQLLTVDGALSETNLKSFIEFVFLHGSKLPVFEHIVSLASKLTFKDEILKFCFHRAVVNNREDCVRHLIHIGADIDNRFGGGTPLYFAAYFQRIEIVRLLIENGASITICSDGEQWSPLHAAYDSAEISRMLLEAGADVNAKTTTKFTPLDIAASNGFGDTIKVHLEFEPSIESKQNALLSALDNNNEGSVRLLLDAETDPRKSPDEGRLELDRAVSTKNPTIVRMLLEYGISLEGSESTQGKSSLSVAAGILNPEDGFSIIKLLVNRGSNIESIDGYGLTPLCRLAMKGHIGAAKYLLSKGAKIDIQCGQYGGPLIQACFWSSLDMVKLLCEHDADVNITCPGIEQSPLQATLYRNQDDEKDKIITYLINDAPNRVDINQSGPLWGVSLNLASLNSNIDIMKLIINGEGVDVNVSDAMGRKPIHFALYRSRERVELLRQHGAQLLDRDSMQRGSLHFAVLSGSLDLVRYVLDEGKAEQLVDQKDIDGWTPLLWALRICPRWQTETLFEFQRLEIIEELLERGAELQVSGSGLDRTWNALKLAKFCGLPREIIDVLEGKGRKPLTGKLRPRWDRTSRATRKGQLEGCEWFCDACLTCLIGVYYCCNECPNFGLCFKCYRSRDIVHPDHSFSGLGNEYEPISEDDEDSENNDNGNSEIEAEAIGIGMGEQGVSKEEDS
ncbi:uncharacterized protein F4812DRAFT_462059 [Daldinia caldariorum]|uniref:uncharacterized protein n=1 Tax=Daldinia caldariorum TaxID=326644 RepID=UPI0020081009|nr:uncharacterized protein F4812DRAFT_462059 [Daldinia caldariorum]KAI1465214.1 hypothetical protein F4812DRAFT_462059 [Daldinia caldariorum]